MFDTLTDRLNGVFKKLRSRGKLHPKQVDNALGEMRVALLEADVSVEVVDDLLSRVRERALSEEIMKSLTPGQQIVKVVNEELTVTLGAQPQMALEVNCLQVTISRSIYFHCSVSVHRRQDIA
jgi:signal recognition particle subunit SRP54